MNLHKKNLLLDYLKSGGLERTAMKKPLREQSALVYVLVALIPYSKPNLLLAFRPSEFFKELQKISRYRQKTLKEAYWRGIRNGLISNSPSPQLTKLGEKKAAPYIGTKLSREARLLVIFDIPEEESYKRQAFRNLLKAWGFYQVQKSVWQTSYDYRNLIMEAIEELNLSGYVEVYECARLFPDSKH